MASAAVFTIAYALPDSGTPHDKARAALTEAKNAIEKLIEIAKADNAGEGCGTLSDAATNLENAAGKLAQSQGGKCDETNLSNFATQIGLVTSALSGDTLNSSCVPHLEKIKNSLNRAATKIEACSTNATAQLNALIVAANELITLQPYTVN